MAYKKNILCLILLLAAGMFPFRLGAEDFNFKMVLKALTEIGDCQVPQANPSDVVRQSLAGCRAFLETSQEEQRHSRNLREACHLLAACLGKKTSGMDSHITATNPDLSEILPLLDCLAEAAGGGCYLPCEELDQPRLPELLRVRDRCLESGDLSTSPPLEGACNLYRRCLHVNQPCDELYAALQSPDRDIRLFVCHQLADLKDTGSVTRLADFLAKENESPVRLCLLSALYSIGSEKACNAIATRTDPKIEGDPQVRERAGKMMLTCGHVVKEEKHDP